MAHPPADQNNGIGRHALALLLFAGILVVWISFMAIAIRAANLSDDASGTVFAVFSPGTGREAALAAIVDAGGLPIRPNLAGMVWTAHGTTAGFAGRLRRHGAIAVLEEFPFSPQLGGCIVYAKSPHSPYSLRRIMP